MAEETTPLTTGMSPPLGPAYVFPGGVSPRSRRYRKMQQFQCCLGITVVLIVLAALIAAFVLVEEPEEPPTPILLAAAIINETNPANSSAKASDALEAATTPLADEPNTEWALKRAHINRTQSVEAVGAGIKALGDREILEESQQLTPIHSPAYRHYRALSTGPEARKLARRGYVENHATTRIAELLNYTKPNGRHNIGNGPTIELPDPTMNFTCDFNARYRTASGVCNNKAHPRLYGAAMIPYRRMVAPDYADGISRPRASHASDGTQLPPARKVSLDIHRAAYDTDANFTVMLAVFGQFLDHDITATSLSSLPEGESIDCCALTTAEMHPECYPVPILPDDPYYQRYNVTCLNFVRSAPAPTGHFGPRQQLNQGTAFIDGSVVYGCTEQRQRHLRTMLNGTMRMYITGDGRQLLPLSTNLEDGCNRVEMATAGKYCFESGDDRANENLLLTSMHLLWARHHNFLARGLQSVNPHWDDEQVFQESRKILSAKMAHITYNEFLPILVGEKLAKKKRLLPSTDDLDAPDTYDKNVDPSIANCFAGAAFRFAHTLLPGVLNATRDNSAPESIELHTMLFNPFSLWSEHGIDRALLTASNTAVLRVNRFFSYEVTQKIFEGRPEEDMRPLCGLDLVSLNIQRGRDHGLPAYPVFRKHCKLSSTDTWEEMANAIDANTLQSIRKIYSSPHDVDVYTGALSEPPLDGAIFGPLLTCLVSDQFMRLKRGDSHWYERKIGPQRFTKAQLRQIYNVTLSKIICQNADDVQQVRKYVMKQSKDSANGYVNCSEIEHFDFSAWATTPRPVKLHSVAVSDAKSLIRVIHENGNSTASPMPKKLVEPSKE
ncbi:PREDICTED: chorion peroxidase [Bactrocera latifrons]|uniref:Chorion peroxidase n=1 Tax=Bactrocera latifrons TaxID=174628 RepID=A0A0K8VML4_BACLA|nr:PREDICTED: chorion peroxidase [Bactrocera latifrons]XP_018783966.1 PREDICTED: chorion peroxidase [Bactrocera latifrons]